MLSESAEKLVGNDAFEGYAIDLIAEIAEILKFNYTFKWVDDGAYGYKNKETGEWNGLMGELLSQVNINIPRQKRSYLFFVKILWMFVLSLKSKYVYVFSSKLCFWK